jgi:NitT/TauT family transport system substrate-binding protein
MNKLTVSTLLLLTIFSGVFLTSCNSCNNDKPKDKKLEKVQIAQFGDVFLYMPLYLAIDKGLFKEEGLDVHLTNTGGDDKTFAAVISGSATFGIADPTFVAIAKEKGQGGKVIASVVNGVPFWGITINPKIPEIKDGKLLSGYSVATFPSPSTAYTLQLDMFEDAGLKPNIKQGAFGALLPMLENNQVDIALELEPNVSTAVHKQGARILYSFADMYGDFAITGVTASDETIKNKPELVQKFVNALEKAEKFAHSNPDSVTLYANKRFPDLDDEIVNQAVKRIISTKTLPQSVLISNESWEKAIDLRNEVGEIKSLEIARSVLDMSFAQKAIQAK